MSGSGGIALLTVLRVGPPASGVDYGVGYPVAAVELIEQAGLRFTACIVGQPSDVRIGMTVQLTWLERDGVPIPAFLPVDDEG